MNDHAPGAALDDLSHYNIMVVDDIPENLRLLSRILEARGGLVRAALSGPIALGAIKHQLPDLLILDIRMPGMDGFEVCRRMKADPDLRDIPIIFISAQHDLTDKVKAFSMGGMDYLTKPFEAEEVIARVKTHLTISTLKRRLQNTNEILEEKVKARTESLQKSEQKYQDLYENAPDMLLSVEVKTATILECNQILARRTGYSKAEIIGQPISHLYTPESWEYAKTTLLPLFRQTGRFEDKELQLRKKDGTIMDVLANASAIRDDHGEILCSRSSWREITKRKKAEKEVRYARNLITSIIDSMPSILVGVNPDGRVTQWNLEAQRALNLSKTEALGQPLATVFPRLATHMDHVDEALKIGAIRSYLKHPHNENGTIRYEDVTIYPLLDGIQGAVIRIDDVTRRVQMEEMMIQSEKMLSVGGLAAGMAHEINNPIAGMIQTANVVANRLGEKLDIPASRKAAQDAGTSLEAIQTFMEARNIMPMLSTIQQSGCRVAEIVENMLSFARKSDAQVSSHSLSQLLDKTLELAATEYNLKKRYDFKKIEIIKEYNDENRLVPCEGAKIQQVLLNILRNGGQAMQEAKTTAPLFILRTWFEKERNMACVAIEDNGPGMDEATRKRAFEPFFTTKPEGTGTGLGLSVSYFIITENHGGELALESRPGLGAKFIIRLPASGPKRKVS
jgi:PAS domain S-box-containing protein